MPLPEATPDGYCVVDHQAGAGLDGISHYTVWASCADCAEPTAAIALIRSPIPVTDDPSHVSNDPSQAPGAIAVPMGDGRGGFLVPPSDTSAISMLYTTDAGGADIVFAGWGLEAGRPCCVRRGGDDFRGGVAGGTRTGLRRTAGWLLPGHDPDRAEPPRRLRHRRRDGVALVRRGVRRHDMAGRHPPAVDGARLGRPRIRCSPRRATIDRSPSDRHQPTTGVSKRCSSGRRPTPSSRG